MLNLIFKKPLINYTFIKFNKYYISREFVITNDQIKNKLKSKWELRKNKNREAFLVNNNPGKNIFKDDDFQELLNKYRKFTNERELRRLNFNRKDRWQQREIDDIMKNFDVKTAKFKDFSKLVQEANIMNVKSFNNVEEIYYNLEEIFKEGFLEEHFSMALDIFLKDINFFKADDLKTKSFINFIRKLSQGLLTFEKDTTIYKVSKFLDWFNIKDIYCWYNLERIVTSRRDLISPNYIIKILEHFANQNQGSGEFYDMYQYLFWSDNFEKVNNSDYISLAYSLYITTQGYEIFYYDYYNRLLPKISMKDSTFDLLKALQLFAELSENYSDIYFKIEDILLSRYEILDVSEAAIISCAYSISGFGSEILFQYMEKIITQNFNQLDNNGFRDVVRGFIISSLGSNQFFKMVKSRIKDYFSLFNITELVFITKCFYDKKEGDKDLFESIEKELSKYLNKMDDILLDELCTIVDCLCKTKLFSREFQKIVEFVIYHKIKEITGNSKICNFLYKSYYNSGMCSIGLMNLLYSSFTGN